MRYIRNLFLSNLVGRTGFIWNTAAKGSQSDFPANFYANMSTPHRGPRLRSKVGVIHKGQMLQGSRSKVVDQGHRVKVKFVGVFSTASTWRCDMWAFSFHSK